ncbi:MAG: DNA polymerase III subunit gamma/tau [Acidimicrobiia bacterium]|nr:DNA polymerase III subunit gamma/tau [Acidimicrobiia bacterium]
MTHQTLYRKYRPQRFADVVGQSHVTRTLQNAVAGDLLGHAYLFCGPRGTGKTTTARLLAKALNCRNRVRDDEPASVEPCNECESCLDIARGVSFDTLEVDAATHRGIDDVRALSERAQQAATDPSRFSVFIIDEVHQLSRDGASAFLKTLEEPPENVVFVLATTDADRMIPTILSRCQRFDFRPISVPDLSARLQAVAVSEGMEVEAPAIEAIARRARGSVRDALGLLEQAHALCDGGVALGDVQRLFGGLDTEDLASLADALVDADPGAAVTRLHEILARGIDPRVLAREFAGWLRGVFLCCVAPEATDLVDAGAEDRARMSTQAGMWAPARATRALSLMGQSLSRMPQALDTRIELESTLVTICVPEADATPDALAVRVEALERNAVPAARAPAREQAASEPESPDSEPRESPESETRESHEPVQQEVDTVVPRVEVQTEEAQTGATPVGLGDVEALWGVVVSTLKSRNRRVGAFFVDSVPVGFEGDKVTIRFAHSFNREQATKDVARELFTDATREVVGAPLTIEGTVAGVVPGPGGDGESTSPPAATDTGVADTFSAVEDSTPGGQTGHDVIDLVTAELGAEVVEERPLDN